MAPRASGPFVSLDDVSWRPEVRTHEPPEALLIAREAEPDEDDEDERRQARRSLAAGRLGELASKIPEREAIALAACGGLGGATPIRQDEIAEMLGLRSQQIVSYMVVRARERMRYLATRPAVDFESLARFLSPEKLEVIREVYETASFTEVGRKRWPCPDDRTAPQRRAWTRVRSNRVKRDFFRAMAKIERHPELADQASALRHLVEHLGSLSRHEGKGAHGRGGRRACHRTEATS